MSATDRRQQKQAAPPAIWLYKHLKPVTAGTLLKASNCRDAGKDQPQQARLEKVKTTIAAEKTLAESPSNARVSSRAGRQHKKGV
jgi:hypothetical protein